MKPAYFQSQNSGRDRWMVSYLDVLTILLILFVAMAAQTLQNSQKKPTPESRRIDNRALEMSPHGTHIETVRRISLVPCLSR